MAVANAIWRQMHTPLHGVAFVLDPKFQMYNQPANSELMANFKKVYLQILPGDEGKKPFTNELTLQIEWVCLEILGI